MKCRAVKKIGILGIAVLLITMLGQVQAQSPKAYLLKIDSVPGTSPIKNHEKEIEVAGYEFYLDSAGGYNFAVKKTIDRATLPLLKAVADRTVYPTATFFGLTRTDSGAALRIKIVFTNLTPNSLGSEDSEVRGTSIVERVTFTYTEAALTYYELDVKNKLQPAPTVTIIPSSSGG